MLTFKTKFRELLLYDYLLVTMIFHMQKLWRLHSCHGEILIESYFSHLIFSIDLHLIRNLDNLNYLLFDFQF